MLLKNNIEFQLGYIRGCAKAAINWISATQRVLLLPCIALAKTQIFNFSEIAPLQWLVNDSVSHFHVTSTVLRFKLWNWCLFRDFFTLKIPILGPVLLYSAIATTVGTQPLRLLYWDTYITWQNCRKLFFWMPFTIAASSANFFASFSAGICKSRVNDP